MIQIYGVITDPAGKPVPGAIIELRSLHTTSEVLMGSVLTFKCDPAGGYRFQLAAGTYDVYAQNDLCGDMDYLGTGVVMAQSADGPLNSILVDSGINLTPPLLERAVEAMNRSESAARAANSSKVAAATSATHTGAHASNAEKAAQAAESAKVLTLKSAAKVDTLAQQVTANSTLVQEQTAQVVTHATAVAGQVKEVSTHTDTVSQAKTAVQGMRDVVVAKTTQAQAAADTASSKASKAAQDQAAASASARRAGLSESMAEAWAQNPEGIDINGRPREFSALHWAMQAQKWAKAITSQLVWLGAWNAAAGAPPTPAAHQGIPFYRISHDGVIAGISYLAGDYLHWDPATKGWFKIDGSDAVISVNGMTGAVVLSAADVGAKPASWVPGWADITNKPVSMPPSEHSHPWSQLSNVPVYASRWPTLVEIGAAAVSHTHPWSQLTGIPVFAKRWPAWAEVTGKPDLAAANHRHSWSQIDQVPLTASRWPSWNEVTNKPTLAAAAHRHSWSELEKVPATASRWPTWGEVTNKPALAAAMADVWRGNIGSGTGLDVRGFMSAGLYVLVYKSNNSQTLFTSIIHFDGSATNQFGTGAAGQGGLQPRIMNFILSNPAHSSGYNLLAIRKIG
ncbi:hypothetical protein C5B78_04580 [Aeromonas salmonicida]|uniref:carboxypeptidase-like regulatory domain-containing protein n=1 Tax=Aeromonas salmonicida TaxID=645 RepID=UPI000F7B8529|nr:carboxypeptidase-like regulatory domain-containing protein [Aeromonas salmonicida]RSM31737.1 hypothetical protein C5B78_04580 [Aeromonas salmonicida]